MKPLRLGIKPARKQRYTHRSALTLASAAEACAAASCCRRRGRRCIAASNQVCSCMKPPRLGIKPARKQRYTHRSALTLASAAEACAAASCCRRRGRRCIAAANQVWSCMKSLRLGIKPARKQRYTHRSVLTLASAAEACAAASCCRRRGRRCIAAANQVWSCMKPLRLGIKPARKQRYTHRSALTLASAAEACAAASCCRRRRNSCIAAANQVWSCMKPLRLGIKPARKQRYSHRSALTLASAAEACAAASCCRRRRNSCIAAANQVWSCMKPPRLVIKPARKQRYKHRSALTLASAAEACAAASCCRRRGRRCITASLQIGNSLRPPRVGARPARKQIKIYAPRCAAAGGGSRRALLHPTAAAAAAAAAGHQSRLATA